jgi:hypothetical protein
MNHCVEGEVVVQPAGGAGTPAWEARTFFSSNQADIERRTRSEFDGSFAGPQVGGMLNATITSTDQLSTTNFLLHVVFQVRKVQRMFQTEARTPNDPNDPIAHPSICTSYGGDQSFETFSAFVQNCGTGYINRQVLGGWMTVTMEISTQSEQIRREISTEASVNLGENTIGFGRVQSFIAEYQSSISNIYMSSTGLLSPLSISSLNQDDQTASGSGTHDGVYSVTLQDIVEFKQAVDSSYVVPLNAGDIHNGYYGVVLEAERSQYLPNHLSACGLNTEEYLEEYECAMESYSRSGIFEDNDTFATEMLDSIEDMLLNDEDFRWEGDMMEMQTDLQTLQNDITNCRDTVIPTTKESCNIAIAANDRENYCTECGVGLACDLSNLQDRFETLTDGINRERGESEHVSEIVRGAGATEHSGGPANSVCVLQKVNGRFTDPNDAIFIEENTGNWKLTVTEGQTHESIYKLRSRMACVPHDDFKNPSETNPSFVVGPQVTVGPVFGSGPTSKKEVLTTNTNHAGAVSGYVGASNGLGEAVEIQVDENATPNELEVKARSAAKPFVDYGSLGRGYAFGFDSPGSPFPKSEIFTVNSNGTTERLMTPVEDTICYFTQVSGEFDGAGERVSIYSDGFNWYLSVDAVCQKKRKRGKDDDCDKKEVKAKAECYLYEH